MCSAVAVTSTTTTPLLHLHTQNTHFIHTEPSTLRKLSLTLQTAQYVDALPLLLLTCTRNYKSGLTLRVITYLLKKHCRFFPPYFFVYFDLLLFFFYLFLVSSYLNHTTESAPAQPRNKLKGILNPFQHVSLCVMRLLREQHLLSPRNLKSIGLAYLESYAGSSLFIMDVKRLKEYSNN